MMKYLNFLLIVLFFSCGQPEVIEEIPQGILTEEQLSKVLADIYLVDAASSVKRLNNPPQVINITSFYKNVYWTHGITEEDFKKSLKYYTERPARLEQIYEMSISVLSELQAKESQKP